MQPKLLDRARGERTVTVVFDPGEEAMKRREEVARSQDFAGAPFTAIGAFRSVTLGFFELARRDYRRIAIEEQREVVSLGGNVALDGDTRRIHAHAVVGRADGTALGGHLLEAHVDPTLEVVIPARTHRRPSRRTALTGRTHAMDKPFLTDIQELRRRARTHIEQGAVTPGYGADRDTVLRLLNEALATEIVCVLRYKRHYFMASGIHAAAVASEFAEHAAEEQGHADLIAERIIQLGGEPDLNPEGLLTRSHSEYIEGKDLLEMIREDLVAERIAIESYGEMVRYFGDDDPTTRRLIEGILATEEEHADDLRTLLEAIGRGEHGPERAERHQRGRG